MSHFPVDKYRECDQFVLAEDTNNSAFEHEKEYIKSEYEKGINISNKEKFQTYNMMYFKKPKIRSEGKRN